MGIPQPIAGAGVPEAPPYTALDLIDAYRQAARLLGNEPALVDLVTATGARLGLNPQQRRRLEFGALLRDVGKSRVPEDIINKSGPLTPEERTLLEQHTLTGHAMLERLGGLLGEVGPVVRSSHERYDGRGYPDGLAGGAIPIESRIIACCDAFNAMTTDRPYRAALEVEEALCRLRKHRGTQFDPDVVDALVAVVGPAGL
jgi:HD-GYP domain-containing protein (c-di-GMP phosphodiesterase class II)